MNVGLIGNQRGFALALARAGMAPVVHTAGTASTDGLDHPRTNVVGRYADFSRELRHPRIVWLDLPLGGGIDATIDEAYVALEPGDVVLDQTGSYWGDTLRRYRRMRHRALFYIDLALIGAVPDGIILAGGAERGLDIARPLLDRLARPEGVIHAGDAGAAHYALMVHEAVATATARALGEAQQMLEAVPNMSRAATVLHALWPAARETSGRGAWLLDDAIRLQASVPLLAQAAMLEIGQALEEQRPVASPARVHGFVHPDDLL